MSEFHVEVVRIGPVFKHPNADRLELTHVHGKPDASGVSGGYPVLFQTGQYKEGDLAVYLPVDSVVPANEQGGPAAPFDFLGTRPKDRRIQAKRLRGVFSMGLLTPASSLWAEGDDVAEFMGVTKYVDPNDDMDEPKPIQRGQSAKWPWYRRAWHRLLRFLGLEDSRPANEPKSGLRPPKLEHLPGYYDLESFRKYGSSWFEPGEEIVVLEKIHGQNASFVFCEGDGKLHLKSRTRWRENDPSEVQNAWAKVAQKYELKTKLSLVPGLIVYGEAYGNNSDMPYGASKESPGFAVFDAFDSDGGVWLDWPNLVRVCQEIDLPLVPKLAQGPYGPSMHETCVAQAEGRTLVPGAPPHVREGVVVRPVRERNRNGNQRVILKLHGQGFLTRHESKAKKKVGA